VNKVVPAFAGAAIAHVTRGAEIMAFGEYTVAFTSRYGTYAIMFIAFLLAAGFFYAFNFTTLFGAITVN
jgi:hypothetical protein